jgi:hypothetical protein
MLGRRARPPNYRLLGRRGWLPCCWLLGLALAACGGAPPGPSDWDTAAQARRPFAWRLDGGPWAACTVVVRAAHPLADEDADELEAVLTDWYNLARLSAFKDDPRRPGVAAAEAMGPPWLADRETLAATLDLGTMGRLGLIVLLNVLEGYHEQQAPLADVVLCAADPPPAPAPGAASGRSKPLTAAAPDAMLGT